MEREKPGRAATSNESDKFIVRMPDGMRDAIAEAARENNRTMNAEVVARLGRSFASIIEPERLAEHMAQLEQLAAERGRAADALAATCTAFAGVLRLTLAKLPAKERNSPEVKVWSSMADAALHGDARGLAAALSPALAAISDGPALGPDFEIPEFLRKQAQGLHPVPAKAAKKKR